jgi:hypothetical protein
MIGFEDEPHRSAEICVFEIFGSDVSADVTLVGMGIHPFGDPSLVDDFAKVRTGIDVSEWHDYAVVWTADDVTFFIDDQPVHRVGQSPQYPMQLMLSIYDFGFERSSGTPQPFVIDHVRVYAPT